MKKLLLVVLVLFGLQTQAQQAAPYFCCESITYWIDQSQGFNIGLNRTGIVHNPDSLEVWWAVCTNGMCYSGDGMYDYFPQVMTTDTVKVCYDVYLYEANMIEVCTRCDTVVFDGANWIFDFQFVVHWTPTLEFCTGNNYPNFCKNHAYCKYLH